MNSPIIQGNQALSMGISVDLVLTVPLIYFLLIRKTKIPNTTVIPVIVIGLILGFYFLPKESQTYLVLFKTWALPVIEVSALFFVIIKILSAVKTYKELKGVSPDFFTTLKNTCYQILPKRLAIPFTTEIAVIYYGFINWRSRPLQENEFTYHKNSGTPALFGATILIIAVETFAIHFLLAQWNNVFAWVLTALSIYMAIQVLGFAKSLSKRPISINQNSLSLKYGILNEVEISFSDIAKIERSSKPLDKNEFTKMLCPLGELESHNMIIHLKNENELIGLYGMKKKFKVIGLFVDQPQDFKEAIEKALEK
ncbi:hypothetical protein [Marivirga sp.]|uniref:hypothetical protein n=1 Tax=Marivirga sp. TaxID=2018662 RepID=UPI003DA755A2